MSNGAFEYQGIAIHNLTEKPVAVITRTFADGTIGNAMLNDLDLALAIEDPRLPEEAQLPYMLALGALQDYKGQTVKPEIQHIDSADDFVDPQGERIGDIVEQQRACKGYLEEVGVKDADASPLCNAQTLGTLNIFKP